MKLTIKASNWSAPQSEFIRSTKPYTLLAGGFGSGKSTAGQAKILALKGQNGTIPGLVVAQTFGELDSNILAPLFAALEDSGVPSNLMPIIRGGTIKARRAHILWPDGQKTYLGSADAPRSYAGLNVGWAYGDEARLWSNEAWTLFESRVRMRCPVSQIALTSTPAMNWLFDAFHDKGERREVIKSPTLLNAANLRAGYIEDLERSYSKRMQAVFLRGEFAILSGAVYEQIDPDVWKSRHVIDWTYKRHEKTYLWYDPGYVKSAWALVQRFQDPQTRQSRWVVFDELILDETTDHAGCQMVNARNLAIDEIWTDPAADNTQSALGLDTIAMLHGIKVRDPRSGPIRYIQGYMRDIPFGVDKVRTALDGDKPSLVFARNLQEIERHRDRGIVKSLMSYRYPDRREGKAITDHPLKDGIHDHGADAVRYGVCGLWAGELRDRDPRVAAALKNQPGYRVAA